MDSNERLSKLEEIVAEILIDTHQISEDVRELKSDVRELKTDIRELKEGQKAMISAFNRFGEAMITKLSELTDETKGMREEMKQFYDHESRIRRIEDVLFKKGA